MKVNFLFWYRWLWVVNLCTLILGLLIAFAGDSPIFDLHNRGTEEVFAKGAVLSEDAQLLKQWLFGIIGATIAAYHLLVLFVLKFAFSKRQKWSWQAIWYSIWLWFLVDSGISIAFGAMHNVLLINLGALLLIALPLLVTRKQMEE